MIEIELLPSGGTLMPFFDDPIYQPDQRLAFSAVHSGLTALSGRRKPPQLDEGEIACPHGVVRS
jgi:hypothetical protein